MLTKKRIIQAAAALTVAVAIIAATTSTAMAAGPRSYVIVVHVTDGSDTPVNLGRLDQLGVDVFVEVSQAGISASGIARSPDGNALGGWGTGPDGVHDDQRDNGDTAAGIAAASRNCPDHRFCHVVLVNYRQPEDRVHRIAAKLAADNLKAAGHRLHAVAIGDQVDARHLGFNWHLSGQAFSANSDEAVETVNQVVDYASLADYIWVGGHARSNDPIADAWDELSYIEKIWLNPLDCDLETQWLWAYDATCHDKKVAAIKPPEVAPPEITVIRARAEADANWRYFVVTDADDPSRCDAAHDWTTAETAGYGRSAQFDIRQPSDARWVCFQASFANGQVTYQRLWVSQTVP